MSWLPIPAAACEHAFAMTSDGSAITRLHRAIANPRASGTQIRAIVRRATRAGRT